MKRGPKSNPKNQCVICLYRVGFTQPTISKKLHVPTGTISTLVFRAGVDRLSSKFSRGCGERGPQAATTNRLIMRQYRQELRSLAWGDDCNHWWRHPACVAWSHDKASRKIYQARLTQELAGFKCHFCGRDASAIAHERRRFGLKYCSEQCKEKAHIAAEKLRIQSNPQLRKRKRESLKQTYHRTRQERPEVYRARVRRKLANPLYRIAKSHRARIYELMSKGVMMKTQTSLKYFGCKPAYLKQHLESQFRPGMTMDNFGRVWHVDHRIPLSKFNLMNPAECAVAFNWQNLQPMFAHANRVKADKVIDPQPPLPLEVI